MLAALVLRVLPSRASLTRLPGLQGVAATYVAFQAEGSMEQSSSCNSSILRGCFGDRLFTMVSSCFCPHDFRELAATEVQSD